MRLISWNVNGLRAVLKKGFLDFIHDFQPDILCLQEVKAQQEQVVWDIPTGYQIFWHAAEKKGYSGTVILCKSPSLDYQSGIGRFYQDREGRVQTLELKDFYLLNLYVPNAQPTLNRLSFKAEEWVPALIQHIKALRKKKPVILCGDLNVAHQEIDLARPQANVGSPGFTDEERQGFRDLLATGLVDIFREMHPDEREHYTWWSFRTAARERNVGWRIDYFLLDEALVAKVKSAKILPDVFGSDHCPVMLELK